MGGLHRYHGRRCGSPSYRPIRGPIPGASRATSRRSRISSPRVGHDAAHPHAVRPRRPPQRAAASWCAAAAARGRRQRRSRWDARSASRPTAPSPTSRCLAAAVVRLRASCASGDYDVVHVHEPIVPADRLGRDRRRAALPLVGTFHTYSTNRLTNNLGNLAGAAPALQPPATCGSRSRARRAWTGERFFGGQLPRDPQRRRSVPERLARTPAPADARSGRCGSPSSARRSSARGCRSRCAPSRRCASTCR